MHKRFFRGFTIIELLIVITVIGILAGIVIVNYRGATSRAYDDAVQDDLVKLSDVLNVYYSDNGTYPTNSAALATITAAKFAKTNYLTTNNSVLYCVASSDSKTMAVIAKSKSGSKYYVFNDQPITAFTAGNFPNTAAPANNCNDAGVTSANTVWIHATSTGWMSNF